MADLVTSTLHLSGSADAIAAVAASVAADSWDLDQILPTPKALLPIGPHVQIVPTDHEAEAINIYRAHAGFNPDPNRTYALSERQRDRLIAEYCAFDAHSWRLAHWGTTRSGQSPSVLRRTDTELVIEADFAIYPPVTLLMHLYSELDVRTVGATIHLDEGEIEYHLVPIASDLSGFDELFEVSADRPPTILLR